MHITDLYLRGFRTEPERLALAGDGGPYTYRQVESASRRIAHRLRLAGFQPGERLPRFHNRALAHQHLGHPLGVNKRQIYLALVHVAVKHQFARPRAGGSR